MFQELALVIMGFMITIIGYFLNREIDGNAVKHAAHFIHANDDTKHQTERDRVTLRDTMHNTSEALLRHEQKDEDRFDSQERKNEVRFERFEKKLDTIIIQLLKNASDER